MPARRKKSWFHFTEAKIVTWALVFLIFMLALGSVTGGGFIFAGKGGTKGKGKPAPEPTTVPVPPPPPADGELVTNGSFEADQDNNGVPDGWIHHYDQPNKNAELDCSVANSGSCSFFIPGKKHTAVKQYIPVNLPAGTRVTLSGWSKAENVTLDQGPSEGSYWVQAWIHYADGSTQWNFHSSFNLGTHGFEQVRKSMVLPAQVEGFTFFAKQAMDGNVWFDDVSLITE